MVGVWLVALVSALEGLNISQPVTWYDPVGDVLQDGLVCVEARPGGPHEPTPQPERAYKRETPMMNLNWTHLCTGANGTNMSSCIGGTARSPLNDLRTSVQPHGSSDSQHVSGLPPLWHEAMFACGPRYFQSSINMHSPRATYERVECFGRILNESRADTMTVVMRYHARGTARSLGHQRPVLRGFAEGTPWDKM